MDNLSSGTTTCGIDKVCHVEEFDDECEAIVLASSSLVLRFLVDHERANSRAATAIPGRGLDRIAVPGHRSRRTRNPLR
jgi:hypothetical protein